MADHRLRVRGSEVIARGAGADRRARRRIRGDRPGRTGGAARGGCRRRRHRRALGRRGGQGPAGQPGPLAWSSPGAGSRRPCTRWWTPSTWPWATSGPPSRYWAAALARPRWPGSSRCAAWSRRSPPARSTPWSSPPRTRSTAPRPTSSWTSCWSGCPNVIYLGGYEDETAALAETFVPKAHVLESWGDAAGPRRHRVARAAAHLPAVARPHRGRAAGGLRRRGRQGRPRAAQAVLAAAGAWPRAGPPAADFETTWETWLAKGVIEKTGGQAEIAAAVDAGGAGRPAGPGARRRCPRGGGPGGGLRRRPQGLRRPLRQQRLAAGAAAPDHQDDLGQRRPAVARPPPTSWASRPATWSRWPSATARSTGPALRAARPRRQTRSPWRWATAASFGQVAKGVGFNAGLLRTSRAPWFERGGSPAPRPARRHRFGITQDPLEDGGPRARRMDADLAERAEARTPSSTTTIETQRGPLPTIHEPVDYSKQPYKWAHVHRPQQVHRLQRLRGRLPVREQHPGGRAGTTCASAGRCSGSGSTATTRGEADEPRGDHPAGDLRALRDRALRIRLPGQRHRPQRRGPERDGLQPLHRHPLLQQQLPLQGPALQLPRLPPDRIAGREDGRPTPTSPSAAAASWRSAPTACSASSGRASTRRIEGRTIARRRDPDRLPAGLPHRGHRVRLAQRPQRPGDQARTRIARRYDLLHELGTRPRTAYLARVRNPNPELG